MPHELMMLSWTHFSFDVAVMMEAIKVETKLRKKQTGSIDNTVEEFGVGDYANMVRIFGPEEPS